ncbi:hypothetical protein ACKWTF_005205 [Chironomus riparius]
MISKLNILLLIILIFSFASCENRIIDEHLMVLRFTYKEFQRESKFAIDKSFFEIYKAILTKISKYQEPYENLHKVWTHMCANYKIHNFDRKLQHVFFAVCEKTSNLLKGIENLPETALNEIFSGGLLDSSPPVIYFAQFGERFEVEIEKIWAVYNANMSCVRSHLYEIIPTFKPFVEQIVNLTETTITKIDDSYRHCERFHRKAIDYVGKFIDYLKDCEFKKNARSCVDKLLLKESKCSDSCGRLFSSIRSAIFTTVEETKIFRKLYKSELYDIADVKLLAKQKLSEWISKVKKLCYIKEIKEIEL